MKKSSWADKKVFWQEYIMLQKERDSAKERRDVAIAIVAQAQGLEFGAKKDLEIATENWKLSLQRTEVQKKNLLSNLYEEVTRSQQRLDEARSNLMAATTPRERQLLVYGQQPLLWRLGNLVGQVLKFSKAKEQSQ